MPLGHSYLSELSSVLVIHTQHFTVSIILIISTSIIIIFNMTTKLNSAKSFGNSHPPELFTRYPTPTSSSSYFLILYSNVLHLHHPHHDCRQDVASSPNGPISS